MYGLTYALGFHWYESRFALALMSLNDSANYKILDLVEVDYKNEIEIEKYIQSMMGYEKVKEIPSLKLINEIIAREIFQRNKHGYHVVECDLETEIQRLNLKLQNGTITIDHSIAGLVFEKLQRCIDYKNPGLSVAAMAIALHDFHMPGEIIRINPNSCGWLNFQF